MVLYLFYLKLLWFLAIFYLFRAIKSSLLLPESKYQAFFLYGLLSSRHALSSSGYCLLVFYFLLVLLTSLGISLFYLYPYLLVPFVCHHQPLAGLPSVPWWSFNFCSTFASFNITASYPQSTSHLSALSPFLFFSPYIHFLFLIFILFSCPLGIFLSPLNFFFLFLVRPVSLSFSTLCPCQSLLLPTQV